MTEENKETKNYSVFTINKNELFCQNVFQSGFAENNYLW